MVNIRYVRESDESFWYSLDKHLLKTEFIKKVRDNMGYIIEKDGEPIGLLRYNLFWDNTPFLTMLYIASDRQGKGYGKRLMEYWENDMRSQGYGLLLVSTQVNECSQNFYRKLGYKDCGGLIMDIQPYEQPMEMFMVKAI